MKKRKLSKKKKFELAVTIILIVLIGLGIAFCIIYGYGKYWIGFSISLASVIVLSLICIPVYYHGTTYECPKCGKIFKANPYKVFFTNGILGLFDFGGSGSKYAKLKCPECKTNDWCKKHYS